MTANVTTHVMCRYDCTVVNVFAEFLVKRPVRRVAFACIQGRLRKVCYNATQSACNRYRADEEECEHQKSRGGGRSRQPITPSMQVAVDGPPSPCHPSYNFDYGQIATRLATESSTQSVCNGLDFKSSEITLSSGARLTNTQVDELLT